MGYPLLGVYALAAAALMAVMAWRMKGLTLTAKLSTSVVALLSIIAVPLLYYRFVYVGTNIIDIYRSAIPAFEVTQSHPSYYIPYYALTVCFLLLAVTMRPFDPKGRLRSQSEQEKQKANSKKQKANVPDGSPSGNSKKQKANNQKPTANSKKLTPYILPFAIFVIIAGSVYHFWYKDANFHHELRMQRCVEEADWEGVVKEGTKQDCEPTRAIVMMHNLALSRLGRQCEEMYKFPKGSRKPDTPLPVYMYQTAGRIMLYHYGSMNECHRVCMEEGVEYGWNVDQLKYLARCAIFNKEPQAARKFLDILRSTSYYGHWASHMETLLNDPQQLAQDKETGPITHMMHHTDHLDAVEGYVERHLMYTLAEEDADDAYFQEQAVIAALWTRNPDLFWPRFEHYIAINGDNNVPRIFQEAAWLFANMQGQEGLDEWVLAPGVRESLAAFMQQMQQLRKAGNRNIKQILYPNFGTTYYYEYFFLKDITYY